jgi:hypothetical protein
VVAQVVKRSQEEINYGSEKAGQKEEEVSPFRF